MLCDCAEIVNPLRLRRRYAMTHHDFHSVRLNKSLLDGYLDAGQHLH